ncbi:class I SAM-dependent DNA methyltransferase [Prevotella nigrescens]|uniref:HsdM family class I SAM-dependent methyltransferase n=1 Tax=Prevotella nigrescens TaxID=28133 RepID=UPI00362403DA
MNINDKNDWAELSGLMPIQIDPTEKIQRFIMLDGGIYDFCLDFSEKNWSKEKYNSIAWSSNTKNYVYVNNDEVLVYNWLLPNVERLPCNIVREKFNQFLRILNSNSYRSSDDVTPFILDIFRSIRNQTGERKEPVEALHILYALLVSLEENNLNTETLKKWGLPENIETPQNFEEYVERLKQGSCKIKPILDLILRHGSGLLFQEAHRIALGFSKQLSLFGGYSSDIHLVEESYSSIHYTPLYLARSIVEKSIEGLDLTKNEIKVLDPACGSGTFLMEVLKQLKEKNYVGHIIVEGWDSSLCAVNSTKFLLAYESRTQWREGQLEFSVKNVRDSLQENWNSNYDLILMNPPFVSMELLKDKDKKDAVNDALAELSMRKRPNQAAAFLYKAVKALSPTGILGTVLPSSILLFEQYTPLRSAVKDSCDLQVVAQLGNYIFENALTDVSVVLLKKKVANAIVPQVIWCKNEADVAYKALKSWRRMKYSNSPSCIKNDYNIYTPDRFPMVLKSWKILPQKYDVFIGMLKERIYLGLLCSLDTVMDIKQGLLRGDKNSFVLKSTKYQQLPDNEKKYFRPLASAETIGEGRVIHDLYIWFPYNESGLMIKSEEQLSTLHSIYEWLKDRKTILEKRRGVKNWWELTRPRSWQLKPAMRLISKRFGSSSSFAILHVPEVIEEGNAFEFKKQYVEDDKYFYLALFSSHIFDVLLSIYAKPLLSGFDLGKTNIKDIPVPDAKKLRDTEFYMNLVECGKLYAEGKVYTLDRISTLASYFYPEI